MNFIPKEVYEQHLERLYWDKLRDWGVTNANLAAKYKLSCLTREECRKEIGWCHSQAVGAIRIPYWDKRGTLTGFVRYRWLSWQAIKKKYVQNMPGVAVYFPPITTEVTATLENFNAPVMITEGEGKVIAADIAGVQYVTIGIGGVNNTCGRLARNRGEFLDVALIELKWDKRVVYIAFDYDGNGTGQPNHPVLQAEQLLASHLRVMGAKAVCPLRFGSEGGTEKIGLDDAINQGANIGALCMEAAQRTEREITNLEADNDGPELHAALCGLNVEFAECRGKVLEISTAKPLSANDFKTHVGNRRFHARTPAGRPTTASLGEIWLRWRHRMSVRGVVFRPTEDNIITQDGFLNTWRGFAVEPRPGDITQYKNFLNLYHKGDSQEVRDAYEHAIAFMFQRREKQSRIIEAVNAREGTGKSLRLKIIAHLVGRFHSIENPLGSAHVGGPDTFTEAWTEQFRAALLVGADEFVTFDPAVASVLRHLATSDVINSNEKFGLKLVVYNIALIWITANEPITHRISEFDRRSVMSKPDIRWTSEEWKTFSEWALQPESLSAIMSHYMDMDISEYNPHAPAPEGAVKRTAKELSRTGVQSYAYGIPEEQELFITRLEVDRAKLAGFHNANVTNVGTALDKIGAVSLGQKSVSIGGVPGRPVVWARAGAADKWQMVSPEDMSGELSKIYKPESAEAVAKVKRDGKF